VELDGVTDGTETWLVECKHVRGAVTGAEVDRLLRKREVFGRATGRRVDRLWIASSAGLRAEARQRCQAAGVYSSTGRDLAQLERALVR
jgi:hypothetical protein